MRRRRTYFTAAPGDPPPIAVEIRRRIAFSEVDAMAVAWHGNYPRFFEAAVTFFVSLGPTKKRSLRWPEATA